jgi:hypothetical protein
MSLLVFRRAVLHPVTLADLERAPQVFFLRSQPLLTVSQLLGLVSGAALLQFANVLQGALDAHMLGS